MYQFQVILTFNWTRFDVLIEGDGVIAPRTPEMAEVTLFHAKTWTAAERARRAIKTVMCLEYLDPPDVDLHGILQTIVDHLGKTGMVNLEAQKQTTLEELAAARRDVWDELQRYRSSTRENEANCY